MTRRLRTALTGLLLLAATAGCGGNPFTERPRPVTVLGPWTGAQAEAFRKVLDASGVRYEYQGTATQRDVLLSQADAGSAPDMVVLPSPGELREYATEGRLQALDGLFDEKAYGPPWTAGRETTYWLPVRVDLKSLVWRDGATPEPKAPVAPGRWCLGMRDPGTSGWPGSDWIEDVLLQQSGPVAYAQWATGGGRGWLDGRVERAWRTWLDSLEAADPPRDRFRLRALRQDFQDEPREGDALERGADGVPRTDGLLYRAAGELPDGCDLEHQGSFARALYGARGKEAVPMDSAGVLPGGPYPLRGREVSGDFAALFRRTPQSAELLEFLVSKKGQESWPDSPPVFSARPDVRDGDGDGDGAGPGADRVTRELRRKLRSTDVPHCLDASDVMLPEMRDAFHDEVLVQLSLPVEKRDLGAALKKLDGFQASLARQAKRTIPAEQVCGPGRPG